MIIQLLIQDAEMILDPLGPQVTMKQTECSGKHMEMIYSLHMSRVHRCKPLWVFMLLILSEETGWICTCV